MGTAIANCLERVATTAIAVARSKSRSDPVRRFRAKNNAASAIAAVKTLSVMNVLARA